LIDLNKVFDVLEKDHFHPHLLKSIKTLIVSPEGTRRAFQQQIKKQIALKKKKKDAQILVKLNSLSDKEIINDLYEAAKQGVDIQLVIRGICCAVTDQEFFKKKPRAISIVDQYLEHARLMIFGLGDEKEVFISSADWMTRNLDHRIEVSAPIFDPSIQEELSHIMNIQLKENQKARILDLSLSNEYIEPAEGEPAVRSQLEIYHYLVEKTYHKG